MRILGIDPGLNYTGWGVISFTKLSIEFIDCGIITPNSKESCSSRLEHIYNYLKNAIEYYKPGVVSLEETFVNKNPASALKLGYARGVALMVPAIYNLKVYEYAPNTVKKTVTGAGHADKDQIKKMVHMILPKMKTLTVKDDAMDAIAIALCHGYHIGKIL